MNEDILTADMMFATEDQMAGLIPAEANDTADTRKYLTFMCDDLRFGVDAEFVVEMITDQPITFLPRMPEFIRGIINLRGRIIPILDIRLRLGKEPRDNFLIMVLEIEDVCLGILVDSVEQMVDIPVGDLLPVPSQSSQLLVSSMCTLPDGSGTMMTLDCDQLKSNEQY